MTTETANYELAISADGRAWETRASLAAESNREALADAELRVFATTPKGEYRWFRLVRRFGDGMAWSFTDCIIGGAEV